VRVRCAKGNSEKIIKMIYEMRCTIHNMHEVSEATEIDLWNARYFLSLVRVRCAKGNSEKIMKMIYEMRSTVHSMHEASKANEIDLWNARYFS
jgi:hypothetical protein